MGVCCNIFSCTNSSSFSWLTLTDPLPLFGGDLSKSESHLAESFSGKGSLMMTLAGFLDKLDAAVVGFLDGLDGAVTGGSSV